jgi:hypothetical protein
MPASRAAPKERLMLILQVEATHADSALQQRLRRAQTGLRSSLVSTYLPALGTRVFTYEIMPTSNADSSAREHRNHLLQYLTA